MTDQSKPHRILLGQITGAHGIRGDILVRTFTGEPAAIAAYGPLTDAAGTKSFKLRIVRVTDKGVVARLDGVTDRNGAEAVRGQELYVERSKLPATDDTEYYHADLIGLAAEAPDGTLIGRVVAVQNFGAGDLLEIELTGGTATEYVQFTNANVPEVDLAAKRVVVVRPVMVGDQEPANDDEADN